MKGRYLYLLIGLVFIVSVVGIATYAFLTLINPDAGEVKLESQAVDRFGGSQTTATSQPVSNMESVETAMKNKYGWGDNYTVKVENISGAYAQGIFYPTDGSPGGGAFLAVQGETGWQIVWDGNGAVNCDEIELYDFPINMLSQCYDTASGSMISR